MRFRLTLLCVLAVLLSTESAMNGQVTPGVYQFGAFDQKGFDTINIANLNALFSVPIFSKAGRGGLNFRYNLVYNSSIWTPVGASGSQTWVPSGTWGWTVDTSALTGYINYGSTPRKCFDDPPGWYWSTIQNNFTYTDAAGVSHDFSNGTHASTAVSDCSTYGSTGFTIPATDASGLVLLADGIDNYRVQYPNGSVITPPRNTTLGAASIIDSNGNEISSGGSSFTDTTGSTVLSLAGSGTASSARTLTYPTYVSGSVSTAYATVHYSSFNVKTAFGCSGISEYSGSSMSLVDYILLADGQKYQFSYEATPGYSGYVTARLAQITLPTGGRISYSYSGGSNGIVCQDGGTATLTRAMLDDVPSATSWTYTRTPGSGGAANSHTEVVDGASSHSTYDFVNDTTDYTLAMYLVDRKQYSGTVTGTPLLGESTCLNGATTCIGQSLTLPITATATTTTLDGSSVKKSTQTFTSLGFVTNQTDYDFGSGSPGTQIHAVSTTYASSYSNLPATVTTYGSSSTAVQNTSYSYDGTTPTATSGLPQHVSAGSGRGNLTSVNLFVNGSTSIQAVTNAYNDAGQVVSTTDDNGNTTSYTYDSGTGTFQTGVSLPTTGSVTHSTGAAFDIPSGVQKSSTDQNGNSSTYGFDNMLRVTSVSLPASGYQTYTYFLAYAGSTMPYVTNSILHAGSTYISSTTHLDKYARTSEVESSDASANDLVDYLYDTNGRLYKQSNPYQSPSTPIYTQYSYDALGRNTAVLDADGSSTSTAAFSGNTTTIYDEASKKRELIADGLGRVSEVLEPDSSNNLTLETDYQYYYNVTGGSGTSPTTYQTVVTQKGGSSSSSDWRVRTFTFALPGRLSNSSTPEEGTIRYSYNSGTGYCSSDITLPCTRTDANSTVTTYTFDALNRPTGRTYSGSSIGSATSAISYYYDQTSYNGLSSITNGIGLRTGMSDGSGATAWSYDTAGNPTSIRRTINGVSKNAILTYNADYSVNTQQDFGGTTFTYTYDAAGRPTSVTDGAGNSYAASAVYNAAGQLTSLNHQLTSGGGAYVRSWQYNNRLQPSSISATLNGSAIQGLTYGYGTGGTNNGNILSITNTMDTTHHRDQTYTYDNLNRLATGNDGTHWGEIYTYDNWGNLYETSRASGYSSGNNWVSSANVHNQLMNQSYDSAGQITLDETSHAYSYDAEGRILSVSVSGTPTGSYVYDGDGNRVKKTTPSITTLYWNGASSLLDESDGTGTTMAKQIQFAGLTVWSENVSSGGRFLFHDHLGSARVTGDASGNLKDDSDYLPFGSLLTNYGVSPSDNHYTFTGDESDQGESGTDYAVYRSLTTQTGRFNRPDPYGGSYDLTNPQSLNRYSYGGNRPLVFMDQYGLDSSQGCFGDEANAGECGPGTGGDGFDGGQEFGQSTDNTPPLPTAGTPGFELQGRGGVSTVITTYWPLDWFYTNASIFSNRDPGGYTHGGRNQAPPNKCIGSARVLKGWAPTIGKPGGFSGSGKRNAIPVTANGAAIIPSQWGMSRAQLRPVLNQISGTFPGVDASFQGVVDTIGSSDVANVQQYLMNKNPSKLIIELPGASKDYGTPGVLLIIPPTMGCPAGTVQMKA